MLDSVRVPEQFEATFEKAQEYVRKYFRNRRERPSEGTIEIFGERYIFVRAASMSVEFFEIIQSLYKDKSTEEAPSVARSLLFDIAHAIGVADAREFHARMNLEDPIEKLSAGPVHFSHAGWAFVDIHPESRPTPDDDYYLIYDHPYSFESDSWIKAGKEVDFPVCIMNAGYSSGWCEESFGLPLVATEILCKAKNDEQCRFIMAPPARIEAYIQAYREEDVALGRRVTRYEIPGFFSRKKVEDTLREREEQYRSIFESATDAFVIADTEGKIVAISPAGCAMFGGTVDDLVGRGLQALLRPDTLFDDLRKHVAEVGRYESEAIGVGPDGHSFDIEISGVAFRYKRRPHLLAIVRDITGRKRMEDELLRARKLESLGVLAGGIAHDFNNILTTVHGNVSLARSLSDADSRMHSILFRAERACVRARDLTMQLLTFSKGGAPVKETASIVELIQESSDFALRGSNVSCQYVFDADLFPVEVDRGQMSQVIHNLVINADQAMPDGGVVTIAARNVSSDAEELGELPLQRCPYVAISVVDHGIGIPSRHLERIFDPYYTTKRQGSGLGLATTYAIVRKHEGHIAVASRIGEGSTFTVHLPAAPAASLPRSRDEQGIVAGRGRILVMDDDEDIRELLRILLEELGYSATVTADGADAVRVYNAALTTKRPFDAVIMDLTIPGGMGGQEALEGIRAVNPEVVAIVSSGYSNDPIMVAHRQHGFAGVMVKPYSIEEVGRALRQVLDL